MRPANGGSQAQPDQRETQRLRIGETFLPDQHGGRYGANGGQGTLEPRPTVDPITEHGQGQQQYYVGAASMGQTSGR